MTPISSFPAFDYTPISCAFPEIPSRFSMTSDEYKLLLQSILMKTLTITKPDDWHIHLRDGEYLSTTVNHCAERTARACVMPNLTPPVTTAAKADDYRRRIMNSLSENMTFNPLLSLYLTDNTPIDQVALAADNENILGFKLYPAGATTHSDAGVTDMTQLGPVFDHMQRHQVPLQIHGEVTDPDVDIFDREAVFIDQILQPLLKNFPELQVVIEHISTKDAIQFIQSCGENVAATITAHHLLMNRNDLLVGGIKPHHYCLPILKAAEHQLALQQAALSGHPKFFFGSDSAPHARDQKEAACGCAGVYTAHASLELLAGFFEAHNALDKLNGFVSEFGAKFYGLPVNSAKLQLVKSSWTVPDHYPYGQDSLIPLYAGQQLTWKLKDEKTI